MKPSVIDSIALQVNDLGKQIDQRWVLRDIRFELPAGHSLAIVGVNGAGKTTLLRCLLDFLKPSVGNIQIFGLPSTEPKARGPLCFLPERFNPPGYLTGHETLVWLAGLRGQQWTKAQTLTGFEQFAIDPAAIKRPLKVFSKGMTQKIGLMACLMSDAPLVVLDEPMSGLDPQARREVVKHLAQAKTNQRSLVFTSHSLPDVQTLADQLVLIHQGRMRFAGSPAALCKQFQTPSLEDAFLHCIQSEELLCPA
jgi:ABC-2 type transport system ATP-binding protein